MAHEQSQRPASVLETVPKAGVATWPWTAADSRHWLLEMTESLFIEEKTNRMASITLKLTEEELGLLTTLASDQLFRREFIDPKMPGNKFNPAEVSLGKKLVERLRLVSDRAKKAPASRVPYAV
jgi:hypothetical protein